MLKANNTQGLEHIEQQSQENTSIELVIQETSKSLLATLS